MKTAASRPQPPTAAMRGKSIATALRRSAFGVKVPVTDPAELERREQATALAHRQHAAATAGIYGNRHARRHRFDNIEGARRPLSAAEKAHRKVRRCIAKASRRANRR